MSVNLQGYEAATRKVLDETQFDSPIGKGLAEIAVAKANLLMLSNYTAAGSVSSYDRNGVPTSHSVGPEFVLDNLKTELNTILLDYNADKALSKIGDISSFATGPLAAFEASARNPRIIKPEMQSLVADRGREKMAAIHVDKWLANSGTSPDGINELLVNLGPTKTDSDMEQRIRTVAEKKLTEKLEGYKRNLESGMMTDTEFENIMTSTQNPQLKNLLEKFWNSDEARAQKKKELDTKVKTDPLVATFDTEYANVDYNGDRIDYSTLSELIEGSPNYSMLPGPVQKAVETSLKHRQKKGEISQEIDELSIEEAKGKEALAKLERNILKSKIWAKRLTFIAGGAVLAALIASGTFPASLSLLSGGGFVGATSSGAILGALAGGTIGGISAFSNERFSKAGIEQRSKIIGAEKKMLVEQSNVEDVKSSMITKDIGAMKSYATLSAKLAALANGLEGEAVVKAYLKKVNLDEIEAILA